VKNLTGVTMVSAGADHSMALRSDGTVWTWGQNNDGQLGDGTKTNRSTPIHIPGITAPSASAAASTTASCCTRRSAAHWPRGSTRQPNAK
jgi:alpha-tubulin suppressor-like RCC1 family protein